MDVDLNFSEFRILAIDDEPINLDVLTEFLAAKGFQVLLAPSGSQGIDLAIRYKPDLILLDIVMPEMDGFMTCQNLKEIPELVDTPVIFMSMLKDVKDKVKGFEMGAADFVVKPFQFAEVFARIKNQLQVQVLTRKLREHSNQLLEEKMKADEARIVAEKANMAKSEFLANMSHELRNPMLHILSFSKFGIDKTGKISNEKIQHYFSKINESGKGLLILLNDLLDLSKLESGRMDYAFSDHNVLAILKSVLAEMEPVIEDCGIRLSVTPPSVSTIVGCDAFKIKQVFRNLLSNAIKFVPRKGGISISFTESTIELDEAFQPALHIGITDQGIGIPENELNTIFDKFTQSSKTRTGAGGTGLGLAICQEIICAHDGLIWAENNPDIGSTFNIKIPYAHRV